VIDQLSPDFVTAYANWLGVTEGEAYHLLKNEPLEDVTDEDVTAAGWEEAEHPRYPEGDERGGQFRPKETEELAGLPTGAHIRVTGGPRPGLYEKQPDGSWYKRLPNGLLYEPTPQAKRGEFGPGSYELLPQSLPGHLGSDRDPMWEADPIAPEPAQFGGRTFSAVENSDLVWNGGVNPDMQYDLDKDEFLVAIGARDDAADVDEALSDYKERLEKNMRRVGEEGELRLTTPDGTVMNDITIDGQFKNQFETGSSGGAFLPPVRAAQEEMFFGYPQDMPGHARPVYGWLEHPDAQDSRENIARQYGTVTWHIKPEVKSRTTVSFLDSLSRPVVPGPIRNPGWRATVPPGYDDMGLPGMITDHNYDTGLFDDLIETQYHGGLSLDDVEAADITVFGGFSVREIADMNRPAIDALEERGIPVHFVDVHGDELTEDDVLE
jgi:hypothetical protein